MIIIIMIIIIIIIMKASIVAGDAQGDAAKVVGSPRGRCRGFRSEALALGYLGL